MTDLTKLMGVGPAMALKLDEMGVSTLEDMARADAAKIAELPRVPRAPPARGSPGCARSTDGEGTLCARPRGINMGFDLPPPCARGRASPHPPRAG